jgi:hypothetical protein
LVLLDLYVKFLQENYQLNDEELSLFQDLDKKVNTALNLDDKKKVLSGDRRKWKILSFNAENFLSFKEVQRDFNDDSQICLINSIPANQGGKSNLTRVLMFLIYGKFYYGDNKSTFEKIFNKFLSENECYVEGELEVNDNVYYLHRRLKRNPESGKVTHRFKIYQYDEKGTEEINGQKSNLFK